MLVCNETMATNLGLSAGEIVVLLGEYHLAVMSECLWLVIREQRETLM